MLAAAVFLFAIFCCVVCCVPAAFNGVGLITVFGSAMPRREHQRGHPSVMILRKTVQENGTAVFYFCSSAVSRRWHLFRDVFFLPFKTQFTNARVPLPISRLCHCPIASPSVQPAPRSSLRPRRKSLFEGRHERAES